MVDFEQARRTMVDTQLRTNNIVDRRVLHAFGIVPRELFVPESRRQIAYIDDPQPLTDGLRPRLLPPAPPVARLLQLAGAESGESVLHVGCGTGYTTAILAHLAAKVVGVDSNPDLVAKAREALGTLGLANASIVEGPFNEGHEAEAPYDLIVVEGSVEVVPQSLFDQLKDRGRLVALIRSGGTATAHVYFRTGSEIASKTDFNAMLPPLEVFKREDVFVF